LTTKLETSLLVPPMLAIPGVLPGPRPTAPAVPCLYDPCTPLATLRDRA
jgi:hypothetical protein